MRDGWIQTTLGDIAEWFSGGTPKAGDPALYGGPIPWAVIADLGNRLVRSTSSSITQEGLEVIGRRLAPKGSVLVSMYGTIGRVSIAAVPMATNQAIAWGVPNPKWISSEYLYELLRYLSPQLDALGRGATQRNINRKIIRDFPVTLPPLAEQKRIVDLIDAVDTYAQKAATYAERSDQASRWLFRALLAEAEESRQPAMRDGWIQTTLGDIAEIVGGGTPKSSEPSYWGGEITWLTPTEVVAQEGRVIRSSKRTITDRGLRESSAKLLPPGAVLLTTRATIGAAAIAGCRLATNQGFQSLVPGPDVDPHFLMHWCLSNKSQFISRAGGNTFLEISKTNLRAVPILLPPLVEQKRIVDVVTAARDVADQAARAASAGQALRTSLSTALLTGRHEIPESYDELLEAV